MRPYDGGALSAEDALRLYQRDQLLWIRTPGDSKFDLSRLRHLYAQHARFFEESWTVENAMAHAEESLTPRAVLGGNSVTEKERS